jgi:hypothetical protein
MDFHNFRINDIEKNMKQINKTTLFKHLLISIAIALVIILCSLCIGMWGYHHFENMPWLDAYLNASMILAGMGPVDHLTTFQGKIFAGTYALFSGIIFLISIAIVLAPALHHILRKVHLEGSGKNKSD